MDCTGGKMVMLRDHIYRETSQTLSFFNLIDHNVEKFLKKSHLATLRAKRATFISNRAGLVDSQVKSLFEPV